MPRAAPLPPPKPPAERAIIPHRRDPNKDVRMFAAVSPHDIIAAKRREAAPWERQKAKPKATSERWYEEPLTLGTLLFVMPPIGLAVLWTSPRYSSDARWALTAMSALMTTFGTAVAVTIAMLALRA
ncbi:MAG TPA: hypothetical protein VM580_08495 [Labilithrix sp.]|nr:hypothetical protein [Labilithrix sp.]